MVTTSPAALTDAIERGSLHEQFHLSQAGVQPLAGSGPDGLVVAFNDVVVFDGDGSAKTEWDWVPLEENDFIELDPTTGATSTALTGSVTSYALVGSPITVTTQELPLTVVDVTTEVVLASTQAVVQTQAEAP